MNNYSTAQALRVTLGWLFFYVRKKNASKSRHFNEQITIGLFFGNRTVTKTFVKAINTTCRIHRFLLTGVKWVTLRADLNV